MRSQESNSGVLAVGVVRDLVSFFAGSLTVVALFFSIAKPTMERLADERAAVVEQRLRADTNEKFKLLIDEIRLLRGEIVSLRMEVSNGKR